MEAGLIAMLIGFMQIIIGGCPWIPLCGMMSLTLFYFGYVRALRKSRWNKRY